MPRIFTRTLPATAVAVFAALCLPAHAQEQLSTAAGVRAVLAGFATDFFVSNCFNRPAAPLRIAVAQMPGSSKKFSDADADTLTGWVEDAFQGERLFQIVPRRRRYEIDEIMKAVGDASQPAAHELDGVVAIMPEGGSRSVNVTAYTNTLCKGPSRTLAVGRFGRTPDIPATFFEHAARRLPGGVTRLVVMPPDLPGLANDPPARVMGRRLQELLAGAAGEAFQKPDLRDSRPVVEIFADGMDVRGPGRRSCTSAAPGTGSTTASMSGSSFADPCAREGPWRRSTTAASSPPTSCRGPAPPRSPPSTAFWRWSLAPTSHDGPASHRLRRSGLCRRGGSRSLPR